MAMAITISTLMGMTLAGWLTKRPAMAIAKTASTSHTRTSTKPRNRRRPRGPMTFAARSATERPSSRTLATRAPKSWTAPRKIVPRTTQRSAGSQPQ
jgi:hypothetical protein